MAKRGRPKLVPTLNDAKEAIVALSSAKELKKLEQEVKLSDVAKTVVDNYMTYHECSLKSKAWIEWYKVHKKIFEDVK